MRGKPLGQITREFDRLRQLAFFEQRGEAIQFLLKRRDLNAPDFVS
ncbi:hypothetical protein ACT2FY_26430 [Paraburkholderia fungorum]